LLAVHVRGTQTGVVDAPLILWSFRAAWLALPFTLAEQIEAATAGAPTSLRWAAATMFWLLWVLAFGASLVPLPSGLTLLRMLVPMAPTASLVCWLFAAPGAPGWIALVLGSTCTAVVMAAGVGDWFVDGASYGDERRFALRPPAALLVGPIELLWLVAIVPAPAGVLLIADRRWVPGGLLVVLGALTAWWGYSACWQLSRRWAVFVPAGLTLVDGMSLVQPALFPASSIELVGPAREGTEAHDLTVGAPGLVLQLTLGEQVEILPAARGGGPTEARAVDAVLVVASRPAAVLEEAERRGLGVGAADPEPDRGRPGRGAGAPETGGMA
jgi:hypothetical protein